MEEQYIVKNGLLVEVQTPVKKKPVFSITLVIFMLILVSFFVYTLKDRYVSVPDGGIVLNAEEYAELSKTKQDLEDLRNLSTQQFILDRRNLEKIFDHIFADVKIDAGRKDLYLDSVFKWSVKYSIPATFILSIIWRESCFDESTVSPANARGPMQVIYKYHVDKFNKINKAEIDLHNIDTGIRIGTEIVREYYDRYNRNIFKTLTAYVGGEHKSYAPDILNRYMNAQIYINERLHNNLK